MSGNGISAIVDFDRYPIADLARPEARAVIADCQQQLAASGLCLLPGFLRAEALAVVVEEARALTPEAHRTEHWRASERGDGSAAAGTLPHETRASMASIAYDRLAPTSPLGRLYEWDGLAAFLTAVFEGTELYRCADPLVSCMVTLCREGDELGWHYDPNDGVVSLLLQSPESGGSFEFVPGLRSAPDAEARELALLEGGEDGLLRPPIAPGTLSLFNGRNALHRVAPVHGATPRIMALFSYAAESGYVFDEDIHRKFFGRTVKQGVVS